MFIIEVACHMIKVISMVCVRQVSSNIKIPQDGLYSYMMIRNETYAFFFFCMTWLFNV